MVEADSTGTIDNHEITLRVERCGFRLAVGVDLRSRNVIRRSIFNDSFVAWLTSAAFSGNSGDFNISYDTNNNPINVNNAFFQACSPANADVGCLGNPSTDACKLGDSELQGTGFYDPGSNCSQNDSGGGSTSWLTTQAPVQPGETITLQFIVWDTGDQVYDSSVLLDNWQWQAGDTSVVTHPVN